MTVDFTDLVEQVAELAGKCRLQVGAAESLTGGAVTSALAAGPAAAEWFRGGIVAYQPDVKFGVLGVEPGPLVTDECAAQLATGAARLFSADAVVATTGVGGPEPEEGQPPGTVHLAVFVKGDLTVERHRFEGAPDEVVQRSRDRALALLAEVLRDRR